VGDAGSHALIMADAERQPFDRIVAALDYPMLIATVSREGEPAGCLVGFGTQCSVDPERFLVCLSRNNRTYRLAVEAPTLVVHALARDQRELAELFGGATGDDIDKFARCRWRRGPDGTPILDDAPAWFAGTIESRLDVGDHVAFVLAPTAAELRRDFEPFPTSRGASIEPGHEA
jgi:flavin reductase (DIM6/NTAB) family NADH-FMN oxidoreductase RutF